MCFSALKASCGYEEKYNGAKFQCKSYFEDLWIRNYSWYEVKFCKPLLNRRKKKLRAWMGNTGSLTEPQFTLRNIWGVLKQTFCVNIPKTETYNNINDHSSNPKIQTIQIIIKSYTLKHKTLQTDRLLTFPSITGTVENKGCCGSLLLLLDYCVKLRPLTACVRPLCRFSGVLLLWKLWAA